MPTMPINADGKYELVDEISEGQPDSAKTRTITFNTGNFNISSREIKYLCKFTSNLASLCGNSLPDGSSAIKINDRAGWWFPKTSDYGEYPKIERNGLVYILEPYTSGKSGIVLKLNDTHGKHTPSNIQIQIELKDWYVTRGSTLSDTKAHPGWMPSQIAIIQTNTSNEKTDYYTYYVAHFYPGESNKNVIVCGYCNSYATSSFTMGHSQYDSLAQVEWASVVTRYGTGSPGSPYSYSGSASVRMKYKYSNASSWTTTSSTSGISGVTGYNATKYWGFKLVSGQNYYLAKVEFRSS